MRIAAPYTNDARWKNIPDEYNIRYSETGTSDKLASFCHAHVNKRINIEFKDNEVDFIALENAMLIHDNIAVRIKQDNVNTYNMLSKKLHDKSIPFFFDDKALVCDTFFAFENLADMGVCDIYLNGIMTYLLWGVRNAANKYGINIRFVANEIPVYSIRKGQEYYHPIFCPKDIDFLEDYFDVIEFNCYRRNDENKPYYDWHIFNVLYKIWIIDKGLFGDLREINKDLHFSFPQETYSKGSLVRRYNCGLKCKYNETSTCRHCELVIELAQTLRDKGIYIKSDS